VELNTVLIVILCLGWLGSSWVLSGVAERWHERYQALLEELDRIAIKAESKAEEPDDEDFLNRMRRAMAELVLLPGADAILAKHGIKREEPSAPVEVSHGN
jgi:hypothetical protein